MKKPIPIVSGSYNMSNEQVMECMKEAGFYMSDYEIVYMKNGEPCVMIHRDMTWQQRLDFFSWFSIEESDGFKNQVNWMYNTMILCQNDDYRVLIFDDKPETFKPKSDLILITLRDGSEYTAPDFDSLVQQMKWDTFYMPPTKKQYMSDIQRRSVVFNSQTIFYHDEQSFVLELKRIGYITKLTIM